MSDPDPLQPEEARRRAKERQARLAKPPESLGRLERLALRLALVQCDPTPRSRPAVAVVFASDHPGVGFGGTARRMDDFARGTAAASVMARELGVPLTVYDVGVDGDYAGGGSSATAVVRSHVSRMLAADPAADDALPEETLDACLDYGRAAVETLAPGTRVLALGESGLDARAAAAPLAAALLGAPAEAVVERGAPADAVDAALARPRGDEPRDVLRALAGRDVAALAGAMVAAVERPLAVLVDGFVATTAALAAARLEPRTRASFVFAHRTPEPGHDLLLEALDASPLLELGMRHGQGTGALAALPLVDLACRLHAEMATLDDASE